MTPEELAAIGERCDKATPGPWDAHFAMGPHFKTFRDIEFIAQARTDVPNLLAEVKRLQSELDLDRRHYDEEVKAAVAARTAHLEEQCRRTDQLATAASDMSRMPKDAEDEANQHYRLNRAVVAYQNKKDVTEESV